MLSFRCCDGPSFCRSDMVLPEDKPVGKPRSSSGVGPVQGIAGVSDEFLNDWRAMCTHVSRERVTTVPSPSPDKQAAATMTTVVEFETEVVKNMMIELGWRRRTAGAYGSAAATSKKKKRKNGKSKKRRRPVPGGEPAAKQRSGTATSAAAAGLLELS